METIDDIERALIEELQLHGYYPKSRTMLKEKVRALAVMLHNEGVDFGEIGITAAAYGLMIGVEQR